MRDWVCIQDGCEGGRREICSLLSVLIDWQTAAQRLVSLRVTMLRAVTLLALFAAVVAPASASDKVIETKQGK
jgi:hypothetical protein